MTAEAPILSETHDGYRVITLNRPDKLNAFNEEMHLALRKAIDDAEADENCRALMITGAGRGFCTGQDLSDRLAKPGETVVLGGTLEQHYNPLIRKLRSLPFPVVAAVNGVAAGAGANIALACDIVIASMKASFIQSFARVGLIPDSGGTWALPRLVGDARARGLALLAQGLDGEKAAEWGLIWRAVEDENLMREATRICEHFAMAPNSGPGADQASPQCIRRQHARCAAQPRARPSTRCQPDARLCRGRSRLHGEAQAELHRPQEMIQPPAKTPLRVGIAGLGAVGMEVAKRLITGVPGLTLVAVAARDVEKARRALPPAGSSIPVRKATELANDCDIVVECLPPPLFRDVAISAIDKGRIFMPLSVAQLLENGDLVERAKLKGARILVPTGALIGLDAVRAAAEGTIHSVKMVTRKPPAGLEGAPYLLEHKISVAGLKEARKVFDGSAREGARGFPTNVNVAAALSLAGIGPDRTQLEIWADPAVTRNTHTITVDADTARFTMTIENIPSENPRTGKSVAPSTVAALRALVSELKVGT